MGGTGGGDRCEGQVGGTGEGGKWVGQVGGTGGGDRWGGQLRGTRGQAGGQVGETAVFFPENFNEGYTR